VRPRTLLIGLMAIAVLVSVGIYVGTHSFTNRLTPILKPEYCTAQSGDGLVTLDIEQMANAATIVAVGIRKGVPDRAVQIALATALQESKLRNLAGGDRDSIGLFQQRPSQGWGTAKEVANPGYASGRFYGALLRVKGWQQMPLTRAAQAVQRSATPDAYAQWTTEADTLSGALLGNSSHAVDCYLDSAPVTRGAIALGALTTNLRSDWGSLLDLAHAAGPNTLALSVRDDQSGWQYAHWLVAHAQDHGIMRVRFGTQQWTAKAGAWSAAGDPESAAPGETVVAEVYGQ
jgi:hypothetical protein